MLRDQIPHIRKTLVDSRVLPHHPVPVLILVKVLDGGSPPIAQKLREEPGCDDHRFLDSRVRHAWVCNFEKKLVDMDDLLRNKREHAEVQSVCQ